MCKCLTMHLTLLTIMSLTAVSQIYVLALQSPHKTSFNMHLYVHTLIVRQLSFQHVTPSWPSTQYVNANGKKPDKINELVEYKH